MRAYIPPVPADDEIADGTFEPDAVYFRSEEWLGIDAAEFVRRYRSGELRRTRESGD